MEEIVGISDNGSSIPSKFYEVRGTRWKQGGLLYGELVEVFKLLKSKLGKFQADPRLFGEIVDELVVEGVLPRLVAILLKPDTGGNIFGRALNAAKIRLRGLTKENVAVHMPAPMLARVVTDFFLINLAWTGNWLNSKIDSESSNTMAKMTPLELALLLTNIFISRPAVTSQKETPSPESPR